MIFPYSLLDEFEIRGKWSLPGNHRWVPGLVRFSPKHGIRLILDDLLESGVQGFKSFLQPKRELYETVHGQGVDGNKFALFGFDNRGFGTLSCRLMVVGETITSERDLTYRAVDTELEGLEAFSGYSPISASLDGNSKTISFHQPEPFSAKLDEFYEISIILRCSETISFIRRGFETRASLKVRATQETPIGQFFAGPTAALTRLLELSAGHRVRTRMVRAESSRSMSIDGKQDHCLLFFRQNTPKPMIDDLYPSDLIFNISMLGDGAVRAIQSWYRSYSDFWPVLAFYFMLDPQFDLDTGLELHFINALSGIEHLHRLTHGQKKKSPPPLKTQLSNLVDLMPQEFQRYFEPRDKFAAQIVATRSRLLHAQSPSKEMLLEKPLWIALVQLRSLLEAGLLRLMELDEPCIGSIFSRARNLRRLQAYSAESVP